MLILCRKQPILFLRLTRLVNSTYASGELSLHESIKDPKLRSLLDHWVEICKERRVPYRSALNPSRIDTVFPNIYVFDYRADVENYVCRLAGGNVELAHKKTLVSKSVDEIFPDEVAALMTGYWDAIRSNPSLVHMKAMKSINDDPTQNQRVEMIMLPLSNAEGEVVQIICGEAYDYDLEQNSYDFSVEDLDFEIIDAGSL